MIHHISKPAGVRSVLLLALLCLGYLLPAHAQQTPTEPKKQGDSTTVIYIQNAEVMNGVKVNGIEKTKFIGNAIFRQGTTLFYCDSALIDRAANTVDAYGRVHINQADSIHTYGDYLHYEGNTRQANLKGNARLTDGKVTITGPELNYDMNAKMGTYFTGGKLVNGKTTLTSHEGYYYADTKDVYFKKDVLLVDPEYTLTTDTLLYNTETKLATIVAPTTINDGKTVMYTTSGFYNTESGQGNFAGRPIIEDSTATITADNIEMNKQTGMAYATGNMIYRDTAQKMSLLSNYGIVNQTTKTVMATQKPLMILERSKDTLYMVADTMYSGVFRPDTIKPKPPKDTLKAKPALKKANLSPKDSIPPGVKEGLPAARNSFAKKLDATDSIPLPKQPDSLRTPEKDTLPPAPSSIPVPVVKKDSLSPIVMPADTGKHAAALPKDTTEKRYILAYHHVRIFSDSLQGVADSVYYSTLDSTFRFFYNPVLWANGNQLSGDTILMFTKDQKADKILLNQNALIINEAAPELYNQIKGNTIMGYFAGENLDWMHVDGNAESIYYIKDDGGGFISVNRSQSAIIDIHFKESELYKINFIKQPEGTMYPFTQRPKDELLLENFHWDIKRRPKSKYELIGH
ncbi:LPS export ABC transporter periplasmic protein LptC [Chitinophaga pendula]|uniref:OstA-like protein n=1 Tax=Chitinophaga TaxID=79328 RepID=UPI000BB098B7|nr:MULTISPECIES: OstA-like protein [Chitinophaga]ASZ13945.1 hypothetical protein CK934_24815 [Chitinophaga sp. MD30]UCJ08435.1 LPS export ABC transporter periplasmic protein LptC [Chitinophaga pendula]